MGFGAHTRTTQARHMVRGLLSETVLVGSVSENYSEKFIRHGTPLSRSTSYHPLSYNVQDLEDYTRQITLGRYGEAWV